MRAFLILLFLCPLVTSAPVPFPKAPNPVCGTYDVDHEQPPDAWDAGTVYARGRIRLHPTGVCDYCSWQGCNFAVSRTGRWTLRRGLLSINLTWERPDENGDAHPTWGDINTHILEGWLEHQERRETIILKRVAE